MIERKSSVTRTTTKRTSSVKPLDSPKAFGTSLGTGRDVPELKVALRPKDRENHTHVLGSTGTGKSKLLEYMLRQDILNRKAGLCLLDPHGTLYDEILQFASHRHPRLADRIVTFNPAQDIDHIVGFNPVTNDMSRSDYLLEKLISACLKAWGQHNADTSPRIGRWLENIFYTIMSNDLTLLETVPLIGTAKISTERDLLLRNVRNEMVRGDWSSYVNASLTQRQSMMEGASNRLRKFLRNETVRLIIGQQKHKLDFHKIMKEGKILLVNLNGADKIDRDQMKLLGVLMVNEIFSAAQLRDPRDRDLKPFYFYIDEFAQFVTRDIAYSLEEARKRKLYMILAHQHLAQLKKEDEYLYASVMTNCKNKIVFGGLSVEDADIMTKELNTGFLDLKTLKHAQYRTRVRHHEETREVVTRSRSDSAGSNESSSQSSSQTTSQSRSTSQSEGTTHTRGKSKGLSVSETKSQSVSGSIVKGVVRGITESVGLSQSLGKQISKNWSNGQNIGRTISSGETTSNTQTDSSGTSIGNSEGGGENWSSSQSNGWSESNSTGSSSQRSSSLGESRSQSFPNGGGEGSHSFSQNQSDGQSYGTSSSSTSGVSGSQSQSQGGSRFSSQSRTATSSKALSSGLSMMQSVSRSFSQSSGLGGSDGETVTDQESSSKGLSKSYSESSNKGWSKGYSKGITQSEGQSESVSVSKGTSTTQGESQSQGETIGSSRGTSQSTTEGESVATVPFLRPEEIEELASVNFWSKDELLHMKQGELKNQGVAQAFVKIGPGAPIACDVDTVDSVHYHPKISPKKLEKFRTRMIAAHPEYFQTIEDARHECHERQRVLFGEPLQFDGEAPQPIGIEAGTSDDGFE
ncbi:MAG: helicase HerA domain-containing protein [Planktomarina sp.]